MAKYVYLFKEADGDRKDLFGGKGANLAKMTSWGSDDTNEINLV